MSDSKLTPSELAALKDLNEWRSRPYCWKPATMRKLAAKGLAEQIRHLLPREAYVITEAGIAALLPEAKE